MAHDDDGGDAALSALIRSGATRYSAPPALRSSVLRALRADEAPPRRAWPGWLGWLRLGAAFASGLMVSWLAGLVQPAADPVERVAGEVVAAHVRSLMPGHLTDVVSSDQHTVKPWLSSRLDFSPPVTDLRADGFPLTGGRLDYIAERVVATLLYQRNQHVINVFVWPAQAGRDTAPKAAARRGFNAVTWDQAGMRYWAVSDLGAGELNSFAERLRQRLNESS
ncbi:MAG: anti-sigma factor [Betaproteobacteria bacterium]